MTKLPSVSVILPVFNEHLEFLSSSINSILCQSFSDFELIVVDDGSTDYACRNLLSTLNSLDQRIRLVRTENHGIVHALNVGISNSKATLIARQDSDDVSASNRLALQVKALVSDSCLGLIGTWAHCIDADGRVIYNYSPPTEYFDILLRQTISNPFIHGSVMFRKSILQGCDGAYTSRVPHCEDYDLFSRISSKHKVANIPLPLYGYRINPHGLSSKNRRLQSAGRAFISYRNLISCLSYSSAAYYEYRHSRLLSANPLKLISSLTPYKCFVFYFFLRRLIMLTGIYVRITSRRLGLYLLLACKIFSG